MDMLLSPLLVIVSKIYIGMWDSTVLRVRANEVAANGAVGSSPKTGASINSSQEQKQA
jgi:hypothetical protein